MNEAPAADGTAVMENIPPPPARCGLCRDLMINLRAGARLAFLRPVTAASFHPSADVFAVIAVLNIVLLCLLSLASVGLHGEFNVYEVPRALLFVPATLLFGLLAMRLSGREGSLLLVAVAMLAAGLLLSLIWGVAGLMLQYLPRKLAGQWGGTVYYAAAVWWALVIAASVARFIDTSPGRNLAVMFAGWLLLVAPMVWYPQNHLWVPKHDESAAAARAGLWAPVEERGFYAQQGMLQKSLAAVERGRTGVADIYLLAAGLYAREDVFMKEVQLIAELFRRRFDTAGRSVVLLNNPQTLDTHPVASLTSIAAALKRVGSQMNRDEDLLVMYVSSHGSESHRLSVDFWPLRLAPIDPPALKQALDASGIKWRVIVVSACYSGGFIKPLQDEYTMIITASSASRQSFGCGSMSDSTWLAQALFNEELRKTYSFETAFAAASKSIAERERAQGFEPSEPQLFAGAEIRRKLAEIESRLAQKN